MPSVTFRELRTGIDRTRRFAAQTADRAYDLVNCYVNEAGRVLLRPGFTQQTGVLPTACRGLFGWRGKLHTFAATPQTNPNAALYVINVLRHPTGGAAALTKVHDVQLCCGALYVVAEFADGVRKHYWLQPTYTWSASLQLAINDLVQPIAPNGFYYQVIKNTVVQRWKPNTAYALNILVQPTTSNGFFYKVTSRKGTNPQSGAFEPPWPTVVGQVITEVHLATIPPFSPSTTDTGGDSDPDDPPNRPNPQTRDRYLTMR